MRYFALSAACLALFAILMPAVTSAAPSAALTAEDAWVRATPGVDVAAAYLTLHNGGTQPVVVIGVSSAVAAAAMIHESMLVNGRSTMRAHEPLRIAAGATVRLAPEGLHIMLHGLKRPLAPGDEVALVLRLEGGGSLTVMARVRPLGDS